MLRALVIGTLALTVPVAMAARLRANDERDDPSAKPSQLTRDLIGTWVLVGTPDNVEEPPRSGGRLKFFTGKHWNITQADPETGKVIFHHGGSYALDGENYSETIEYANENTAEMIKQTLKFKIKVEGDTYTQVGVGNPYTEVWKRAK